MPSNSMWVTDVWWLWNMETVFNHLNKLQFWMDEQRLHMHSEAHSNTLRRREFQGSIWMDLVGMWLYNSTTFLKWFQTWRISKTFFPQSYWCCWPGTRPEEISGCGSGASGKCMWPAASHSIPCQSDAHKDICLAMFNSYHLSRNKVCCRLTLV